MEADYSMTQHAFAISEGKLNAGDEQLLVRFFYQPTKDEQASLAAGRPIYVEKEWIEIGKPGDKLPLRVGPARARDLERFPEHYKRFKARETSEQIQGTLLEHWPGVIRSQVEELRFFNIRTVEQLAAMSDSSTSNFRDAVMLKEKAKAYLEASKGNAAAEELAETRQANAALEEKVNALMARLEQVEAEAAQPKRRGRPPKQE